MISSYKICTKCKQEKLLGEFYTNKKGKHSRESRCKQCFKQYYQDNKKEILVKSKKHREKIKQKAVEFHKRIRETDFISFISTKNDIL